MLCKNQNRWENEESCLFPMKWKNSSYFHPKLGKKNVKKETDDNNLKEKDDPNQGEVCKNCKHNEDKLKRLQETIETMKNISETYLGKQHKG